MHPAIYRSKITFLNEYCKKVHSVLAKVIWMVGGNATVWISFSTVLRAGLENQLPHQRYAIRIAALAYSICKAENAPGRSGKNTYDLGNDLFTRMLTLICNTPAVTGKKPSHWKLHRSRLEPLPETAAGPGMQVLDIGCGWGGLAAYMAKNYHVSVTGVTISAEQQKRASAL
jgi:cyclopropane-fatty-acyl-phospholipid synthase